MSAECGSAALAVERGVIDREVAPGKNRLAVFRGGELRRPTASASVTKADTAFPDRRDVSLVLEQYGVPPGLQGIYDALRDRREGHAAGSG